MVEDTLMKLVTIDSPSGYETSVGKFVMSELENVGSNFVVDKSGNILANLKGKGIPRLLSAHLDTVQGNSHIRPINSNGVIKSSGNTILGADNKASVAAILTAIKLVPEKNRRNVEMVFSVREETDGGVNEMDVSWIKSKKGISADSGEAIGSVISETPFIETFEVTVIGKSSHSSEPENGINALSIASEAISKFKWGSVDGCSTANIGLIEGGSAVNTTPGRIYLKGEIRSCSRQKLEELKASLDLVFKTSAKNFKGKVKLKYNFSCDGYSYKGDEYSIKEIKNTFSKLKIKSSLKKSFGASDANFFCVNGIEVIDIGDGVINPHTNDEQIKVKDLNQLTNIFTKYISV